MKLILVDQRHGQTKTVVLKGWMKGLLSFCFLGAPVALGYFGFQFSVSQNGNLINSESTQTWNQQIRDQASQLDGIKEDSKQQIEALTIRLANLQAKLTRLEAVGERVTRIAGLDEGEFDFDSLVGVGGPGDRQLSGYTSFQLNVAIEQLERKLEDRENQLVILEELVSDRQMESDSFIGGKPLDSGWVASGFGHRPDPFTGKLSFHSGIDFTSGKKGAEINTVAAGVVTWSGPKSRYGLTVEVNHGNGFVTRYSHAEQLFVGVGDLVRKGQTIALVGSTGRSTGPHVHFEIYKNGRVVDPTVYINRTLR